MYRIINRWLAVAVIATTLAVAMSSCGSSHGTVAQRTTYSNSAKTSSASKNGGASTSASKASTTGMAVKGASAGKEVSAPLARIDFKKLKLNPVAEKLLREADSWIGTSYSFGGNDRDGVDCSGFVVQVFSNSLGISLPRNSQQQHQYCDSISRDDLMPGDLVFFSVKGGESVGHVGIYIGNDQMVHSSSSKGVIISSLNHNYYVSNYRGSGRVNRYYAMCGGGAPAKTDPEVAAKRDLAAIGKPAEVKTDVRPLAKEPEMLAAIEPAAAEPDVAVIRTVIPQTEVATAVSATSADDEDNEEAIRRRAVMRVARIGHFQQDKQ